MRILFVDMPFGGLRPAIGVSLLAAHLRRIDVESHCLYLNIRFARRVGRPVYEQIGERAPIPSLAGDWVFARSAFGPRDDADSAYLVAWSDRFAMPQSATDALLRCRAAAEDFLEESIGAVHWDSYDVVGFTSTFCQTVASLALARRLKARFPHLRIVFGGANCEGQMGLALHSNFKFIDFVCSGEGDVSFPRLVRALMSGREEDIPGIISRRDGGSHVTKLMPDMIRDMDALPIPVYDDYVAEMGAQDGSYPGVLMECSRGCWWGQKHHCTFCGLNGSTMIFRSKSAQRALDEMVALAERYSPSYIEMVDNILDMRYFRDLIPELKARNLRLELFFEVKANLTKAQVAALRAAGIKTIQPGIENFSDKILRSMRKGTTGMQNVQLLKWCREMGVSAYWNLLYGFPGEDPADYEATVRLIDSIVHLRPPEAVGAIRLDRFSPYFFDALELGLCNIRPDRSYDHVYDLPDHQLSELAYYFEFDYADGRDPDSYAEGVRLAVHRWHGESSGRGLVCADHGDVLAIWDLRPRATRTVTVLTGANRELYLFCDQHRGRAQAEGFLRERQVGDAEISAFLSDMLSHRLMLELDGRLLSLAVPIAVDSSPEPSRLREPLVMF
jgi:ribosomal peptide maturation radical SAM protein 1